MVAEAAQVAGFGQDGEREDRTDAGNLLQTLKVDVVLKIERGPLFELIAQLAEADHLPGHNAKHGNRFRPVLDGESDRRLGCAADILQKALFTHLPSHYGPRTLNELLRRRASDVRRRGKQVQELQQPLGARCIVVRLDLRKVQGQIMRQQPMLGPGLLK